MFFMQGGAIYIIRRVDPQCSLKIYEIVLILPYSLGRETFLCIMHVPLLETFSQASLR